MKNIMKTIEEAKINKNIIIKDFLKDEGFVFGVVYTKVGIGLMFAYKIDEEGNNRFYIYNKFGLDNFFEKTNGDILYQQDNCPLSQSLMQLKNYTERIKDNEVDNQPLMELINKLSPKDIKYKIFGANVANKTDNELMSDFIKAITGKKEVILDTMAHKGRNIVKFAEEFESPIDFNSFVKTLDKDIGIRKDRFYENIGGNEGIIFYLYLKEFIKRGFYIDRIYHGLNEDGYLYLKQYYFDHLHEYNTFDEIYKIEEKHSYEQDSTDIMLYKPSFNSIVPSYKIIFNERKVIIIKETIVNNKLNSENILVHEWSENDYTLPTRNYNIMGWRKGNIENTIYTQDIPHIGRICDRAYYRNITYYSKSIYNNRLDAPIPLTEALIELNKKIMPIKDDIFGNNVFNDKDKVEYKTINQSYQKDTYKTNLINLLEKEGFEIKYKEDEDLELLKIKGEKSIINSKEEEDITRITFYQMEEGLFHYSYSIKRLKTDDYGSLTIFEEEGIDQELSVATQSFFTLLDKALNINNNLLD